MQWQRNAKDEEQENTNYNNTQNPGNVYDVMNCDERFQGQSENDLKSLTSFSAIKRLGPWRGLGILSPPPRSCFNTHKKRAYTVITKKHNYYLFNINYGSNMLCLCNEAYCKACHLTKPRQKEMWKQHIFITSLFWLLRKIIIILTF